MKYDVSRSKHHRRRLEKAGFSAILSAAASEIFDGARSQGLDITTNAKPAEIQKLFPDSVYETPSAPWV